MAIPNQNVLSDHHLTKWLQCQKTPMPMLLYYGNVSLPTTMKLKTFFWCLQVHPENKIRRQRYCQLESYAFFCSAFNVERFAGKKAFNSLRSYCCSRCSSSSKMSWIARLGDGIPNCANALLVIDKHKSSIQINALRKNSPLLSFLFPIISLKNWSILFSGSRGS